jgi:L-ascorbate metabolism protein UlaG (beta-lactamase superfamily)
MFLPINGRDAERYRRNTIGNMTYQEAADLAGALRPKVVAPMHYDMFAGNAEDPGRFLVYLHAKFPGQRAWAGRPGERFEVAP